MLTALGLKDIVMALAVSMKVVNLALAQFGRFPAFGAKSAKQPLADKNAQTR